VRNGWFKESHRHALAAKGISTRRYMRSKVSQRARDDVLAAQKAYEEVAWEHKYGVPEDKQKALRAFSFDADEIGKDTINAALMREAKGNYKYWPTAFDKYERPAEREKVLRASRELMELSELQEELKRKYFELRKKHAETEEAQSEKNEELKALQKDLDDVEVKLQEELDKLEEEYRDLVEYTEAEYGEKKKNLQAEYDELEEEKIELEDEELDQYAAAAKVEEDPALALLNFKEDNFKKEIDASMRRARVARLMGKLRSNDVKNDRLNE